MGRRRRSELVDGFCHVTARGNRRREIFPTPLHCFDFLLLLDEIVRRSPIVCHGFCLMPNHVHLVLDAEQPDLSDSMRRLFGVYARRFNISHGLTGHVFEGRFGSEPIVNEPHLLEVVRYVVLNPVRAQLCTHPGDWPWSSYGAYLDETARPPFLTVDFVLELFAPDPPAAARALERFVQDGLSAYPKPYVPGNLSARSLTSRTAGRPTTLR